jgi:hypothetical protein
VTQVLNAKLDAQNAEKTEADPDDVTAQTPTNMFWGTIVDKQSRHSEVAAKWFRSAHCRRWMLKSDRLFTTQNRHSTPSISGRNYLAG